MTGDRPGIVFLTPVLPAAHGNGLAMRAGLFLEGLARSHAVAVVVAPVFGPPGDNDFVGGLAKSWTTLELNEPGAGEAWPSVLLGTPAGRQRAREVYPLPSICRQPTATGQAELSTLVAGARLVHVMRNYLAPCLDFLVDRHTRPPVTLDLDELDSAVARQLGRSEQAESFERLERYYLPRVDHVYTASSQDAGLVSQEYGAPRVTPIANAVRLPDLTNPLPAPVLYDLLFVGNLSYEPNIDAVRWLCGQILPLLGPVRVAIVGSRPGPEVRRLAELPGVTVAGDVAEVASWYYRSRVAVAPLRIGGGTRIKIIEALAHERPVVATILGATGLAVGDDFGVLTGGPAGDFAAACRRLLDDPPAAARIAAAGRRHASLVQDVALRIDSLTRSALKMGPVQRTLSTS